MFDFIEDILSDVEGLIADNQFGKANDLCEQTITELGKLSASLFVTNSDSYYTGDVVGEVNHYFLTNLAASIKELKMLARYSDALLWEVDNPYGTYNEQVREQYNVGRV